MKLVRTILIYVFIGFLSLSLVKNLIDYQKKIGFYQNFKNQYEADKKRNQELQTKLRLQTDPNEIEKTIRNKLDLAQPGEVAIILPQPSPTPNTPSPKPEPNWIMWKKVFFKN